MAEDPFARFQELLAQAAQAGEPLDATAASLATADAHGRPANRMVLLKGVDARGFVFYTNYESRKGRELEANPQAALCFQWHRILVQARIEGRVERVSPAESDAYFATRPRGHQLSAWASNQSAPVTSREELVERYRQAEARFAAEVARPSYWGGYRLLPDLIEFWHGKEDRLHDRFAHTRHETGWRVERLFP